jgi:hypothetical protein
VNKIKRESPQTCGTSLRADKSEDDASVQIQPISRWISKIIQKAYLKLTLTRKTLMNKLILYPKLRNYGEKQFKVYLIPTFTAYVNK